MNSTPRNGTGAKLIVLSRSASNGIARVEVGVLSPSHKKTMFGEAMIEGDTSLSGFERLLAQAAEIAWARARKKLAQN